MNEDKLLKDIIDEIAAFFSSELSELRDEIKAWGQQILKIKLAIKLGNGDKYELEKTEKYAWARVLSLKAKYEYKIEQKSWQCAEKIVKVIKNAVLFG